MDKKLLDIYSDYLVAQNRYATAIGLSDEEISHDKITRFLNSKESSKVALTESMKSAKNKVSDYLRSLDLDNMTPLQLNTVKKGGGIDLS